MTAASQPPGLAHTACAQPLLSTPVAAKPGARRHERPSEVTHAAARHVPHAVASGSYSRPTRITSLPFVAPHVTSPSGRTVQPGHGRTGFVSSERVHLTPS